MTQTGGTGPSQSQCLSSRQLVPSSNSHTRPKPVAGNSKPRNVDTNSNFESRG